MSILTHILAAMGGGFVGVIFWSLFFVASDADKAQEPLYDEDKRHSGLLEED